MIANLKVLLLIVLLLNPEFELGWVQQGNASRLRASLVAYDQELSKCLESGLMVRLRFEFALCKKRRFWFNDCSSNRVATSSVEYDPISETYEVNSDLLGDSDPPQVSRLPELSKALDLASQRSDITVSWLYNNTDVMEISDNHGIRGRVNAECRGEYSDSMKKLSYILSFGFIKSKGYDSGWVEFKN